MTNEQWRDLGERAAHTFWQGAVAAAPVSFVPDLDWAQQTAVVMVTAGLASLLSMAKGMVKARKA